VSTTSDGAIWLRSHLSSGWPRPTLGEMSSEEKHAEGYQAEFSDRFGPSEWGDFRISEQCRVSVEASSGGTSRRQTFRIVPWNKTQPVVVVTKPSQVRPIDLALVAADLAQIRSEGLIRTKKVREKNRCSNRRCGQEAPPMPKTPFPLKFNSRVQRLTMAVIYCSAGRPSRETEATWHAQRRRHPRDP
jgi:hypothetical protein